MAAQPATILPQDEVIWELATWPGTTPDGQPQTQAESGEDWLYSISQSRTTTGALDGHVTAGYSTYPTVLVSPGCQTQCNPEFGCTYPNLTKITPGGEVEWHRTTTDIAGVFWKVIGTADGGYLAVGHTADRGPLLYNPTAPGVGIALDCWPPDSGFRSRSIIFAVKYDHAGNEIWKYAYGEMDNPNDHLPGGSLQVQPRTDIPWDVVQRPDGGFRIVACAVDPDIGMNPRAFVIDVDGDGVVQDRQVYGEGGDPSDRLWRRVSPCFYWGRRRPHGPSPEPL